MDTKIAASMGIVKHFFAFFASFILNDFLCSFTNSDLISVSTFMHFLRTVKFETFSWITTMIDPELFLYFDFFPLCIHLLVLVFLQYYLPRHYSLSGASFLFFSRSLAAVFERFL